VGSFRNLFLNKVVYCLSEELVKTTLTFFLKNTIAPQTGRGGLLRLNKKIRCVGTHFLSGEIEIPPKKLSLFVEIAGMQISFCCASTPKIQ